MYVHLCFLHINQQDNLQPDAANKRHLLVDHKSTTFGDLEPSVLYQVCMLWRKDLSNNLRKAAVATCQYGEGYKAICKQFQIHFSTVRKIIKK